jgi:predicted MPP superfamily phosphohydrolase
MSLFVGTLLLLISQIYWACSAYGLIVRQAPARLRRPACFLLLAVYGAAFGYNIDRLFRFPHFGPQPNPTALGLADTSLALMQWWMLCSCTAFVLALPVEVFRGVVRRAVRERARKERKAMRAREESAAAARGRKLPSDRPAMPDRRHFLDTAAGAVLVVPFLAGGYALLYGRLDLEVTRVKIGLGRLPREFHGFRVAQLSDIHISAFMPEEQIRKHVGVANSLRPDLILLTGDFVTWDPGAQQAVVHALADLRAPFGVFGCLGNHEAWSGTKDSISTLFAAARIRIMRDECSAIDHAGEQLNLIGIEPDYGWEPSEIPNDLIRRAGVNILMSHYPTMFDQAASQGIDLMLAGHTHGGQVKLNFISPDLAPRLLRTPYIAGLYQKDASQLYVNRGIGTIGVPMRAGMRPEITVIELEA